VTGPNRKEIMSNIVSSEIVPGEPMAYQIRIRGHLGRQWTDWFGRFAITLEPNGDTLLTGRVVDQAALYGVLRTVRNLGMPLISVSPVEPGSCRPGTSVTSEGGNRHS
jgi:O-antigen/teichoic acid export membrane protein